MPLVFSRFTHHSLIFLYSIPGPFIFCFWLLDSTPGVNVIYPPVSERVSTVGIILFYNLTWVSFGVIGF